MIQGLLYYLMVHSSDLDKNIESLFYGKYLLWKTSIGNNLNKDIEVKNHRNEHLSDLIQY